MERSSLLVIIKGIAKRVASAINDWVFGMKETGMSDENIKTRLAQEVEAGRIISEMKNFATAFVPGYTGDMVRRFGRDTIASDIARMRNTDFNAPAKLLDTPTSRAIVDEIYYPAPVPPKTGENAILPTPGPQSRFKETVKLPPKPDGRQLFVWISVRGSNTCSECRSRHGQTKTLAEWTNEGMPRSNICQGGIRCRCDLVAAEVLAPDDIPEEIVLPAQPKQDVYGWVVREAPRER